ncbi:MmcQ/YjbR family DNA-binding protein [Planotetraspora sp. GP83]|uniref:MmcQ/YjbR family DNA-binding protein n=1 Tax=Planotetraspora sp. GP83 TaxID=3156264 RepID=UPI003515BF92
MSNWRSTRDQLREFALGLPEAHEDFPWGETVVKVNKKVFVFLGLDGEPTEKWTPNFTVKLRDSHGHALSAPGAAPSGYGLGKAGWVTVPFTDDMPEIDVLRDWVEESYRIVAPKRLVAELDGNAVAFSAGSVRQAPSRRS